MSDLRQRYEKVIASIPGQVTLVAVSKTRSIDEIQALYEIGQRHFGENKAQELKDKAPALPDDIIWHFIGHLQTNKVKQVVPYAHMIHSVDSLRVLEEMDKRAAGIGKVQDVLLQIFISAEEQKFGLSTLELNPVLKKAEGMDHLRIRGLMGMATFTEDDALISSEFQALHKLFASAREHHQPHFDTLSMGMSGDVQLAINAGSTMVRVGTAIFGPRK